MNERTRAMHLLGIGVMGKDIITFILVHATVLHFDFPIISYCTATFYNESSLPVTFKWIYTLQNSPIVHRSRCHHPYRLEKSSKNRHQSP